MSAHPTTAGSPGADLALALRGLARDIDITITELSGTAAVIALARESALRLPGAVDIAEALAFVRDRIDAELFRLRSTRGATSIGYTTSSEEAHHA